MTVFPFPPFEPDKARFNSAALPVATNVLPTADGWGPMPAAFRIGGSFEYLTDEAGNRLTDEAGNLLIVGAGGLPYGSSNLATDCKAVISARKTDGTERIFAATATKLWEYNVGSTSWQDVTRTSGGDYTASDYGWTLEQFGSYVYAANGVDTEQMIDLDAGTNFVPNTTAPIAATIRAVGNFMFRGNVPGTNKNRVQWSAIDNPQSNTAGVSLSDYQDLPTGTIVQAIVPLSSGAHVWMSSAVHQFGFALTSDWVFTTQQLTDMRGTSAPKSVVVMAQDDYSIYGDDGFWRFAGGWTPIGEGRVNKWARDNIDAASRNDMIGIADPERKIAWWSFTTTTGTRVLLGYSYAYDRWCYVESALLAGMRARTIAYLVEGAQFAQEDLLKFAAVDDEGWLVFFEGDNMAATFTTNEISLNEPNRSFISGGRLLSDALTHTATLYVGDYKGGTMTAKTAVSPSTLTKHLPLLGDGRVHKIKIEIPAATTWTTAGGIDLEIQASAEA